MMRLADEGGKNRPDYLDRLLSAIPLLAVYFASPALLA